MFVAIVTAPFCPASAMICASFSWFFALSTLCGMPRCLRMLLSSSDCVMDVVPMRIGCPFAWISETAWPTALYFARFVL